MDLQEIVKLDGQYYFNVFGKRLDVNFRYGRGMRLYDEKGREYTDFLAGIAVNCLGYGDEGFTRTIAEQSGRLIHLSNYFYNENQAMLAKLLCDTTGFDKAFFTNSGTESNEGAMKLARKYFFDAGDPRHEIVSLTGSFHGRSLATLTATGQDKFHTPYKPLMETFRYVPVNDAAALEKAVTPQTCAVIMEPLLGEGGIVEIDPGFAQAARRLCDRTGALLIVDEIQTGMGRTGRFLASEHLGVKGDIVTLAKALGNGLPIGAILATDRVAAAFGPGDHGSTFAGNFLTCAAGHYVLQKILTDRLTEHCEQIGGYFKARLCDLSDAFPFVREVRGRGLMLGMELDESVPAKEMQHRLLGAGFLVCTAGLNTLRFLPPFIVEKAEIDALTAKMEKLFNAI